MAPKLRILVSVVILALPLDQISKMLVDSRLAHGERLSIIDGFFYITHARNPGAAFGLFGGVPSDSRLFAFALVSLIAILAIAAFYHRLAPGDRIQSLGLSLVLAGAAGNFIDRIWRGEVIDFLHVRLWGGYAWPDFNVADSAIVVGVGLLMLELLASEGEQRVSASDGESGS